MIQKVVQWVLTFFDSSLGERQLYLVVKKAWLETLLICASISISDKLLFVANEIFDPVVMAAFGFVALMMILDVVTGVAYNLRYKVPPEKFDKGKVFKSLFQFGLVMMLIFAFSAFEFMLEQFNSTGAGIVMGIVEGGVSGLFMTLLLLLGLVLLYDFVERGAKMNMPGAPTILSWIKGLIEKMTKNGQA